MKEFLQKYDKFWKGNKTYILTAIAGITMFYLNAQGGELQAQLTGAADLLSKLSVMVTDGLNQWIAVLLAWKAFNRASQDA